MVGKQNTRGNIYHCDCISDICVGKHDTRGNTHLCDTRSKKRSLGNITWACERFHDYLIGIKFQVETDHKPLVSLLGEKNLEDLPAVMQRFQMRLMQFTFSVTYIPQLPTHCHGNQRLKLQMLIPSFVKTLKYL